MLRIESPPSGKQSWTTSIPESCLFAVTRPTLDRHTYLTFRSNSLPSPFQGGLLYLRLVPLCCLAVSGLPGVMSKSNNAERENLFHTSQMAPLTSRSQTHRQTDKSKIIIMIVDIPFIVCQCAYVCVCVCE